MAIDDWSRQSDGPTKLKPDSPVWTGRPKLSRPARSTMTRLLIPPWKRKAQDATWMTTRLPARPFPGLLYVRSFLQLLCLTACLGRQTLNRCHLKFKSRRVRIHPIKTIPFLLCLVSWSLAQAALHRRPATPSLPSICAHMCPYVPIHSGCFVPSKHFETAALLGDDQGKHSSALPPTP